MTGVYIFLADGFEETEALAPYDVLVRAGIPVKTVSINSDNVVTSSHGVPVIAMMRLDELKEEAFDEFFGEGTGAAVIFGATGGVMEAALRSAYYLVTGKNPNPDAFKDVRGIEGWKEASFEIEGIPLKVAVVSGLRNARELILALKRGEVKYDFVEVMACPGGCSGGGGQPIHAFEEMAEERGKILYGLDRMNDIRFSHENPTVKKVYEEFLEKPLSEKAHHLLHTDYNNWDSVK